MIYELREYTAAEGAAERLHQRFADHTLDLFDRHGIAVVGFWRERSDPGRVVYLTAFEDEEARERAWAGFQSDADWQRVKAASEDSGPVVADQRSRVLIAPEYAPQTALPADGQDG